MRSWVFLCLVLVSTMSGCAVRVPAPVALRLAVRADVQVRVKAEAPVAVPIQGAAVVEFFGVPLDGAEDIVFVLDRSGSMSGLAPAQLTQVHAAERPAGPLRKIDVAQDELVDALQRLPAGTRINVLFFDSDLEAYAGTLFALDESDRPAVITYVKEAAPGGATALAPAMRTAFLMNAKRIVLLSDGRGNVGGDSGAILRDAREAMAGGVRIDTIGLGSDQDAGLLRTMAAESGGIYQPL